LPHRQIDLQPFYFQIVVNCYFLNSFLFKRIRIALCVFGFARHSPLFPTKSFIYRFYAESLANPFIYRFYANTRAYAGNVPTFKPFNEPTFLFALDFASRTKYCSTANCCSAERGL
jgi:hypothetical protein